MGRIHHAAVIALVVVSLAAVCLAQDADYISEIKQPLTITGDVGFGSTVALSPTGNTLAVGMPLAPVGANTAAGSVGVYTRANGAWVNVAILSHPSTTFDTKMGISIALTDNVLVAGAPRMVDNKGALYFFTLGTTSWIVDGSYEFATKDHSLGASVATDGTIIVAGIPGRDSTRGGFFVFTRSGTPAAWTFSLSTGTNSDAGRLGSSIALGSNLVVTGAPGEINQQGTAYVWTRTGNNPVTFSAPKKVIITTTPEIQAMLGTSVAIIADNFIAVSTTGFSVYLFSWDGTEWRQSGLLSVPVDATSFGMSMSFSAKYLIVGSSGKAFLYLVSGTTVSTTPKELKSKNTQSIGYGRSVAVANTYVAIGENYLEKDTDGTVITDAKSTHTFAFPDVPSKVTPISSDASFKTQRMGDEVDFFRGMALVSAPYCETPLAGSSCDGGNLKLFQPGTSGSWVLNTTFVGPFLNGDNRFGGDFQAAGSFILATADDPAFSKPKQRGLLLYKWDTSKFTISLDSIIRYPRPRGNFDTPVSNFEDVVAISFSRNNVYDVTKTVVVTSAGSVTIFTKNAKNQWTQQFILTAPVITANERFGHSTALQSRTRIAVSNNPPTSSTQSVYIYELDANTKSWILKQTIPSNSRVGFGWKIGFLADQTLCVSAYGDSNGAGSLVIYSYSGTQYESPVVVIPNILVPSERFGYSFANEGSQLVVGAKPCDDTTPSCGIKGSAYLFSKDSSGKWNQQKRFVSDVTDGSDGFGHDVAISGTSILVSAPLKMANSRRGDVVAIQP